MNDELENYVGCKIHGLLLRNYACTIVKELSGIKKKQ